MQLTKQDQDYLLQLVRQAIVNYFHGRELPKIAPADLPSSGLAEKKACFVTLTIDGKLRGCIGNIVAMRPLYQDVIDNAVNAAYEDPRFLPLTQDELQKIKIEISVLSLSQQLSFKNSDELLAKIRPNIDGIILESQGRHATFLPQVWEKIPQKEDFLNQLCLKAGASTDCWQDPDVRIRVYQVQKFKE